MPRILGIDPGSRITGYGLIEHRGRRSVHLVSGCIRAGTDRPLAERLTTIHRALTALIAEHRPDEMAVEQVFMHRNPDAAFKLGQARGVAILAGGLAGLPVSEYAPRSIKQAVVGKGGADKEQVQHMVSVLLNLHEKLQADAADALAVALCHGHTAATGGRIGVDAALLYRRRR